MFTNHFVLRSHLWLPPSCPRSSQSGGGGVDQLSATAAAAAVFIGKMGKERVLNLDIGSLPPSLPPSWPSDRPPDRPTACAALRPLSRRVAAPRTPTTNDQGWRVSSQAKFSECSPSLVTFSNEGCSFYVPAGRPRPPCCRAVSHVRLFSIFLVALSRTVC